VTADFKVNAANGPLVQSLHFNSFLYADYADFEKQDQEQNELCLLLRDA
jgi:hypothetical protein